MNELQNLKTFLGEPYYETPNGLLYNADCISLIKKLPDNAVTLVLTDPPYGIGLGYDSYNDSESNLSDMVKTLMPELLRISKRVAITPGVNNVHLYPKSDWILVWVYNGGANYSKWGFNCWQPILVYGPDPYLENSMGCHSDVINYEETPPKGIDHPCPKPINFWTRLLKRCSVKETDIVIDTFMGSGSTALSCERMRRPWIGIELSEKYCRETKKRLEKELAQLQLF